MLLFWLKALRVMIGAKIKINSEIFLWNVITFNQIWSGFYSSCGSAQDLCSGKKQQPKTGVQVNIVSLFCMVFWKWHKQVFPKVISSKNFDRVALDFNFDQGAFKYPVNLAQSLWLQEVIKWAAHVFLSFDSVSVKLVKLSNLLLKCVI